MLLGSRPGPFRPVVHTEAVTVVAGRHGPSAARGRGPDGWASVRLLLAHAAVAYAGPLAARITIGGDVPGGTDA